MAMLEPLEGETIDELSRRAGYPDVQTFMEMNSGKVGIQNGVPFVYLGEQYPQYVPEGMGEGTPAGEVDVLSTLPEETINHMNLGTVGTTGELRPMEGQAQARVPAVQPPPEPKYELDEYGLAKPPSVLEQTGRAETPPPPGASAELPTPEPTLKEIAPEGVDTEPIWEPLAEPEKAPEALPEVEEGKPAEAPPIGVSAPQVVEPVAEVAPPAEVVKVDDAKAGRSEAVANTLEQYQKIAAPIMEMEQADVTISQNAVRDIESKIDAQNRRIEEISAERIKPFFGEQDTGRKILAAIAAGLGAYAAAMTGTRNFALEQINAAIDRDLAKQAQSRELRLKSAQDQRLILLENKADLTAYARSVIANNLAIVKAQTDVQMDISRLIQADQQLEMQANKIALDYETEMAKIYATAAKTGANYIAGLGRTTYTGQLKDAAEKEGISFMSAYNEIKQNIPIVLDLLKQPGAKNPSSAVYSQIQSRLAAMAGTYKNKIANLGAALSQEEAAKFLNPIIPFGDLETLIAREWAVGEVTTRLTNLDGVLDTSKSAFADAYGFRETAQPQKSAPPKPPSAESTLGLSKGTAK